MTKTFKKLIEVALPLEAINKACAREKSIRHGHPSTLHLWWARDALHAAGTQPMIFRFTIDESARIIDGQRSFPAGGSIVDPSTKPCNPSTDNRPTDRWNRPICPISSPALGWSNQPTFEHRGVTTDFNGASMNFPFADLLARAEESA